MKKSQFSESTNDRLVYRFGGSILSESVSSGDSSNSRSSDELPHFPEIVLQQSTDNDTTLNSSAKYG